jgi:HlyD family secretion protein
LNQADVIRLQSGQAVDVQVEAVPGLKLKGTVERIAPQAMIKNNVKGFSTQIRLKTLDPRVRPGMTANLIIPILSVENVLTIPLAAVFTEENRRFAYVKTGADLFTVRDISVGVSDYQYAEILKGLSLGEVVSLIRPAEEKIITPLPEPVPSAETQSTQANPGSDKVTLAAGEKISPTTNSAPQLR